MRTANVGALGLSAAIAIVLASCGGGGGTSNDAVTEDLAGDVGGDASVDQGGGCTSDDQCADEDPCTEDKCNAGVCENPARVCNDGLYCNGVEACDPDSGECIQATPIDLDDGVLCTVDKCDEETDQIVHDPDNAGCDDGDPCTDNVCDAAAGCLSQNNKAACDDGDPCTENDKCADGQCGGAPKECDDGQFCNGTESCDPADGSCTSGTAPETDDGIECTKDSCDEDKDEVVNEPDGTACDDGNVCTDDVCDPEAGCSNPNNTDECDDGDPCTVDDACVDGACSAVPKVCSDGKFCNGLEACDTESGDCLSGEAPLLDDEVDCTLDSCSDEKDETVHTPDALQCADENPCTDTVCDPQAGCVLTNNTAECSDGDPCTVDDVCAEGKCAGVAKVCSDGQFCNGLETCKPDTGECLAGIAPVLDDKVDCTVDSCDEVNDKVVNAADDLLCADQNPCTSDTCDALTGCVIVNNTDACNDGDLCTVGDVCGGGSCKGTPKVCSDGKFCNGLESCVPADGSCVNGDAPVVDDQVACTVDSCDEDNDVVKHVPDHASCNKGNPCADYSCDLAKGCLETANTKPCDDQEACTSGDVCADFQCKPGKWTCEDCSNQVDDNDDGNTDCCDALCKGTDICKTESVCGDQIDDDCDLAADCLDEDCLGSDDCGPYPQYGDIVVTEVMQNPASVDDAAGEWFEVMNLSGETFNLAFLEVSDGGTDYFKVPVALSILPGGLLVFARNGDPAVNGGVEADFVYSGFSLANDSDEIILALNGVTLDEVAWDGGATFPDPNGASMQLDPDYIDADENDDGNNWCASVAPWALDLSGDFGTPGDLNFACMEYDCGDNVDNDGDGHVDCKDPDCVGDGACADSDGDGVYDPMDLCPGGNDKVDADNDALPDACEIGWVGEIWPNNGTSVDNKQDLTVYVQIYKAGVTDKVGQGAKVEALVKYKMVDGAGYVSAAMEYNKDVGNNDEYKALIPASFTVAGGTLSVDFEVRFVAGVAGVDYLYNNGPIKDQASMPAPMLYPISAVPESPVAGDIVIDEIMFNPSKVSDDKGEWFEIYNKSDKMLELKGIKIASNNDTGHTIASSILLPPFKVVSLGNNGDLATNGGAKVSYAYPATAGAGVILANTSDAIWLEIGGVVLDKVAYGTGAGFPNPNGASLVLHQDYFDPVQNDSGNVWCMASTPYGSGDLGTPGATNDKCGL
jgi:hypothetical protein